MKSEIKYAVGAETLQEVLTASLKAESTYEFLISKTDNRNILDWLDYRKEKTTDFIIKLLLQLETMDVKPKTVSNIQSKIHSLFANFKSLVTPMDDEFVIRECVKADERYILRLSEICNSTVVTDKLHELYASHIEFLRNPSKRVNDNIRLY